MVDGKNRDANVSYGTFYQYFKDKGDLVQNICFDILSPINPFGGLADEISDFRESSY